MREIFISIDEIDFRILTQNLDSTKTPLILLHGFAGSANIWKFLFERLEDERPLIAIDLVGHGSTSSPKELEPYNEISQLSQLNKIFDELKIREMVLLGYSMGGRLALSYTLNNPLKVKSLILESASAGLETDELRKYRIENDNKTADKILNNDLEDFFTEWYQQPIFNSLKNIPGKLEALIQRKIKNNKTGLVNSLKGFGTGVMKSYWHKLEEIAIPVLLICGSLDKKFVEINKRMNSLILNSQLQIIKETAHITHLEKPDEFLNFVNSFLRTFEQLNKVYK